MQRSSETVLSPFVSREHDQGLPRILVLVDYYIPGFKSGGPQRTISNLVDWLGDRARFFIFTRDRDVTDSQSYDSVQADCWTVRNRSTVYYASPKTFRLRRLLCLMHEIQPDTVYLNSFFSRLTIGCLLLRALGRLPRARFVIAPRGEFAPAALRLKRIRKRLFVLLGARVMRLYDNSVWQASSLREKQDIEMVLGDRCAIKVAPNLPVCTRGHHSERVEFRPRTKHAGLLRLATCARISRMKNLHWLFPVVHRLRGNVALDIYGPERDEAYSRLLKQEAAQVPPNIEVRLCGALPNDQVVSRLSEYHYFVLPTLGENFGHAILEGLLAGCPVIISDRTPWRELERKNVGWDLPLEQPERWLQVLQTCVDEDNQEYQARAREARNFATSYLQSPPLEENAELFELPCAKRQAA
jgi:glycosyltransferase involved in cell wall biosynthesis